MQNNRADRLCHLWFTALILGYVCGDLLAQTQFDLEGVCHISCDLQGGARSSSLEWHVRPVQRAQGGDSALAGRGRCAAELRSVCVHACTRACVHACIRECLHACMCACVHACMHACVHACMRACVHACMRACMHACMRACVHTCMRACAHARIRAYVQTCMRACMHVCMRACRLLYTSVSADDLLCVCICVRSFLHTQLYT